jgi:hypothetical protein
MLLTDLARRLALAIVALFGVVLVAFLVAHLVESEGGCAPLRGPSRRSRAVRPSANGSSLPPPRTRRWCC